MSGNSDFLQSIAPYTKIPGSCHMPVFPLPAPGANSPRPLHGTQRWRQMFVVRIRPRLKESGRLIDSGKRDTGRTSKIVGGGGDGGFVDGVMSS